MQESTRHFWRPRADARGRWRRHWAGWAGRTKHLTDDVCSATHRDDVVECLTLPPPCEADLEEVGCDDIMDECAAIDAGTCYWGMASARKPEYIETCFAEPANDESCQARFMRCAWDL